MIHQITSMICVIFQIFTLSLSVSLKVYFCLCIFAKCAQRTIFKLCEFLDALASLAFKLSQTEWVSEWVILFQILSKTLSAASVVSTASSVSTVSTVSSVATVATVSAVDMYGLSDSCNFLDAPVFVRYFLWNFLIFYISPSVCVCKYIL